MKVERILNDNFFIYIFSSLKDCELEDLKIVLPRFQKILKLRGFYKVVVCKKKVGLFLQILKVEDSYYRNTLDFRIVSQDMNIYFQTKEYFLLNELNIVRYYDGVFYGLVDDSFDKILEKVEFGSFVLESNISDILEKSILI